MEINTSNIAIKIANGSIYGVRRITGKGRKGTYFEELSSSQNLDLGDEKISLILPSEIVSFKIATYPFKLNGRVNTDMLAKSAVEELTPLNTEELIILKHKISEHTLLIEYAKKKIIAELINKYNYNKLGGMKIYFPFSTLCSIGKRFYSESDEQFLLRYSYFNKSTGVLYRKEKVSQILDLNYEGEAAKKEINSINTIDLNEKAREIFSSTDDIYSDLFFLIDDKQKQILKAFLNLAGNILNLNILEYITVSDIITKSGSFSSKNSSRKFVYAVLFAALILIFATAGLIEENYYKNAEKADISRKINLILGKYMPGQKVFYEPRYEIKSYYDGVKENYGVGGENNIFLNFLNYISEVKRSVNSLKIYQINYSFKKLNFRGSVLGYKNMHKLEVSLKQKHFVVDVLKSYKNSKGNIKFAIALKK